MSTRNFRTSPQLSFLDQGPLIVDNFAGGGGASTGIEMALGRPVDIAINHDPKALAMHEINHPKTMHLCENVWQVDPVKITRGRDVELAWFSPDCTHHSKAAGKKPLDKNIRGLAWVVPRWGALKRPNMMMLENVQEFMDWGPLTRSKRPCKRRKGLIFDRFVQQIRALGYQVEFEKLIASHYGAPTSRKRLFMIARRDKQKIVWPEATHGPGLKRYRTAADIIDWSLPCHSIFMSKEQGRALGIKRPLAENTLKRIARGLWKFVINNPKPYIVKTGHTNWNQANGIEDPDDPLSTIVTQPEHYLVMPMITRNLGWGTGHKIDEPAHTILTNDRGQTTLVTAHMIKLRNNSTGTLADEPVPTITAGGGHIGEVRYFMMKYYGNNTGQIITDPLHTITNQDRFGLVAVHGDLYQIIDIGFRMLTRRELYLAQGFPADYIIEFDYNGKLLTKTDQGRMVGNSVPPQIVEALVSANVSQRAFDSIREAG